MASRITTRLLSLFATLSLLALPAFGGAAAAASPAWTGTGCTDPALGVGIDAPMESWVWTGETLWFQPGGQYAGYSESARPVAFPPGNYPWAPGVDDPAPLLWYATHVPGGKAVLGSVFATCQGYTPQLITAMNATGFAPSEVGGVNPTGVSAPATTTQQTQPAPSPAPIPPTPQTHSTQPSPQTQPSQQQSTTPVTAPPPQYPPVLTSPAPQLSAQQIANIIQRDRQLIAAEGGQGSQQGLGSGATTSDGGHSRAWWVALYRYLYRARYLVAAVAAVAILVVVGIVWRRRRTRRHRWPQW